MHTEESRTRPLLLGHRGARAIQTIPENTFASFDRALADGCDGFEFDLRLTADGEAVVCHDPQSRATEIARTDAQALHWLPRLADVLIRYQDRAFLDIELKVAGLDAIVLALLKRYPPNKGFICSSFLGPVLSALHGADTEVPLGIICENREQLQSWNALPSEYVIAHVSLVDADLVGKVQRAGKKMFVWTVNDPKQMRRLKEMGVNGLISDATDVLCQTLRR